MESGDKARAMVARFRALLARGATLETCESRLRLAKSYLHRIAEDKQLPRRLRRRHTAETYRAIYRLLDNGLTERAICDELGVGKGTVYRRKEARRKRLGLHKQVKPYFCQGCRSTVTFIPCQVCAARAHEAEATRLRTVERQKAIAATRGRRLDGPQTQGKAGREYRS